MTQRYFSLGNEAFVLVLWIEELESDGGGWERGLEADDQCVSGHV